MTEHAQNLPELAIRIFARRGQGYSVEMTLDGQPLPSGHLAPTL